MADYRAPLHDMMFVLQHIAGLETIAGFPPFGQATVEMTEGVLQEAARLFEAEVAPLNRVGDLEGSRVVAGSVVTAPGWKEAYSKYVDAGWGALPFPEEHGGGECGDEFLHFGSLYGLCVCGWFFAAAL